MSKFYAVRNGVNPGIYDNWIECQKQVRGFPKACFKSFKLLSEAECYMIIPILMPTSYLDESNPISLYTFNESEDGKTILSKVEDQHTQQSSTPPKEVREVVMYTDGSHQRSKNYVGFGAWCKHESEVYEMSGKCNAETMKMYDIDPDTLVSNPTAEFMGFAEVIRLFHKQVTEDGKDISKYKFVFKIDYIGVGHWMSGQWQCKASYIRKIKDHCTIMIKDMNMNYVIEHVKGHSGDYGNDQADRLATSLDDINTFVSFFDNINL